MPCSLVHWHQYSGGDCCLYLQNRKLTFYLEDGSSIVPHKRWYLSMKLCGLTSHKILISVVIDFRTSNVMQYQEIHVSYFIQVVY
jgi:hypothetical protein